MEIDEILSNESLRQREFPVVGRQIFLGHAGVAPLPARVGKAIREYSEMATVGNQEAVIGANRFEGTRRLAARMIDADPEEIALLGPTSLALSYIASGVSFEPGDNVLVYFADYPSNVYPWMALQARGVEVRFVQASQLGRIGLEDVRAQVDGRTRLVALASCHFISGWRIDLNGIGAFLRERNILFSVDGIQTVGAFPTAVTHVDFLAADSHKWMLGPCGAGILYVRKRLHESFCPPVYGWHNIRSPDFVTQEKMTYREGAKRYEVGTPNFLGQVGMQAALELLNEIGLDAIAKELLRKRQWLVPALREKGYHVLQADAPNDHGSGIVTFYKPGTDMGTICEKMERESIFTSLRVDPEGNRYIRLSPHFYNTDDELKQVLQQL